MGFVRVVPDGREIRTHLSNANFGARHRLRGLAGRRGDGGCPTRRAGGRGCPATDDVRDVRVVPDRKQIRTHRVEAGFAAPLGLRGLAGRGVGATVAAGDGGWDLRAADVPTNNRTQSERSEGRGAIWGGSVVVKNVVCGGGLCCTSQTTRACMQGRVGRRWLPATGLCTSVLATGVPRERRRRTQITRPQTA